MLAGYGRYVNDNVRTEHLKCSRCRTQIQLTGIETDPEGCEVRSFSCQHCAAVSKLRLCRPSDADADHHRRDLGAR